MIPVMLCPCRFRLRSAALHKQDCGTAHSEVQSGNDGNDGGTHPKRNFSIIDILHENTCGILGGEEGNVFRIVEGLIIFSAKLEAGVCGQVMKWILMAMLAPP